MDSGTLYICATPIGNLEDISFRVLRCLKEVDLIAAEDTRNSIKLLNHFEIKTPMTAYHEFNKFDKAKSLVKELLNGKNIAIITDAGTPCISDPGEELVRQAIQAGISITSLPGPAALITALTLSGLQTRRFVFEAFLPYEKKERRQVLTELSSETRTIILYEAPHRLRKTLGELADVLGQDRKLAIIKELTKTHENALYTNLGDALLFYEKEEPRGEYVLVIEGKSYESLKEASIKAWEEMSIEEHILFYTKKGHSEKDAMKMVAKDRAVSKREIYHIYKALS